ncbi:MAG TPA: ABC transporter ATP-binding protein [Syntrophorhabdales bacterium]|nr:ABC transporter ATP-binding protein [Syntrophorhabdales bacterium]
MTEKSGEILLNVENLGVIYNNVSAATHGVSLKVYKNQIVALLGTNGAGKSSTLKAISGFLGIDNAKIAEGFIEFKGERIQNQPPHTITCKGIALVPEWGKVFENLTVEENLEVCVPAAKHRVKKQEMAQLLEYFPPLQKARKRLAGYLSGGERQMLSISTALLCKPDLLLVDELSLGLAPMIVDELMGLLKIIRDEQAVTILLVEQNALAALEIADYGYVIENGRIVFAGSAETLLNHKDIQEFYLGQGNRESRMSYRDVKQYRRTRRWYG